MVIISALIASTNSVNSWAHFIENYCIGMMGWVRTAIPTPTVLTPSGDTELCNLGLVN